MHLLNVNLLLRFRLFFIAINMLGRHRYPTWKPAHVASHTARGAKSDRLAASGKTGKVGTGDLGSHKYILLACAHQCLFKYVR
jgi:hypothetical protein